MDLTFDLVEEQIEYLQNTVGSALYQVNHKSYHDHFTHCLQALKHVAETRPSDPLLALSESLRDGDGPKKTLVQGDFPQPTILTIKMLVPAKKI